MSRKPAIRRATVEDAAELARLISPQGHSMSEVTVAEVWGAWEAEGNVALVVQGEGSLLGAITLHRMHVLHRAKPVGRITALSVDPAAQGRGLGRALIAAAEEAMIQAGCGLVEVTSHKRRTEAHAFYRHIEYEQTSFRFAKVFTGPAVRAGGGSFS